MGGRTFTIVLLLHLGHLHQQALVEAAALDRLVHHLQELLLQGRQALGFQGSLAWSPEDPTPAPPHMCPPRMSPDR